MQVTIIMHPMSTLERKRDFRVLHAHVGKLGRLEALLRGTITTLEMRGSIWPCIRRYKIYYDVICLIMWTQGSYTARECLYIFGRPLVHRLWLPFVDGNANMDFNHSRPAYVRTTCTGLRAVCKHSSVRREISPTLYASLFLRRLGAWQAAHTRASSTNTVCQRQWP